MFLLYLPTALTNSGTTSMVGWEMTFNAYNNAVTSYLQWWYAITVYAQRQGAKDNPTPEEKDVNKHVPTCTQWLIAS